MEEQPKGRKKKRRKAKARSPLREEILNLPNILTMGRVAIIPFVIWAMAHSDDLNAFEWAARRAAVIATTLFALASITDFLDGWLARNLNMQSVFGRFLDPLADKLLVMACLIQLVEMNRAPTWLVLLLLSREVGITGLRAIAAEEGFELPSDRWGKWKTAMQMLGLIGLLLHFPIYTDFVFFAGVVDYHRVGLMLLLLSMVFSMVSAVSYMFSFMRASLVQNNRRTGSTGDPL
ncbi:MAG: CDP-diacylglycerol--glycerol-3-phosphate 3-phosphatidyltransferase [Myxococcota bacterium]